MKAPIPQATTWRGISLIRVLSGNASITLGIDPFFALQRAPKRCLTQEVAATEVTDKTEKRVERRKTQPCWVRATPGTGGPAESAEYNANAEFI